MQIFFLKFRYPEGEVKYQKVLFTVCVRQLSKIVILAAILSTPACKKLVTVQSPTTASTNLTVFSNDGAAASVLTGLYSSMSAGDFAAGVNSISIQAGLSADELTLYSGTTNTRYIAQYKNSLSSNVFPPYWSKFYFYILTINSEIEGLSSMNSLTPSVRSQLLGESLFMRAFIYSYLVELYQNVPLITSSNYTTNAVASQATISQVFDQIVNDLREAKMFLLPDYFDGNLLSSTSERTRPNKYTAEALLARIYLYMRDWQNAKLEADSVINNTTLYSLNQTPDQVFLANSSEAIWQLQPVNSGWNTEDARTFILPKNGPTSGTHPVYLSQFLLNSFEPNDQRKNIWVDSLLVGTKKYFYPAKYKSAVNGEPITEYLMVMRLAEQYLIRAEALAELGDIDDATNDINLLRSRAGLVNLSGLDNTGMLNAIQHESQVELFTEWGHRWIDLKRRQSIDSIMTIVTPAKGATWTSTSQLYPIPNSDILADPNLKQNPGY